MVHLQFDDPVVPAQAGTTGTTGGSVGDAHVGAHGHVQPWGIASLQKKDGSSLLVSGQGYDVKVVMTLPRTKGNIDVGNFMLDLKLLEDVKEQNYDGGVGEVFGHGENKEDDNVLARSRRPATLTYYSPLVEYLNKALELPWYVLGWRKEAETLDVRMMEGVEFGKRRGKVPGGLRLEVQSHVGPDGETGACGGRIHVYGAKVVFRARFRGLR